MSTSMMKRAAGFVAAFFWAGLALANGEFSYPQTGPLTSNYYSPRPYGIHGALDIAGRNLSPLHAARAGTVVYAGWNSGGYGNLVIIQHEAGYQTYYAHQSHIAVSVGQGVARGQTIGYEGTTGNSTGPHVHFEVRRNWVKQYLPGQVGDFVYQDSPVPWGYPGLSGNPSPSPSPQPSLTAQQVTTGTLNVRTGPGVGNSIIGTVHNGQIYAADASSGSWHRIFYDNRSGWCYDGYLTRRSNGIGRRVTAGVLNVRTGPGTNNPIAGVSTSGEVFVASVLSNGWLKIWYRGGQYWISAQYTSIVRF